MAFSLAHLCFSLEEVFSDCGNAAAAYNTEVKGGKTCRIFKRNYYKSGILESK